MMAAINFLSALRDNGNCKQKAEVRAVKMTMARDLIRNPIFTLKNEGHSDKGDC